jgi:hypothetical protein
MGPPSIDFKGPAFPHAIHYCREICKEVGCYDSDTKAYSHYEVSYGVGVCNTFIEEKMHLEDVLISNFEVMKFLPDGRVEDHGSHYHWCCYPSTCRFDDWTPRWMRILIIGTFCSLHILIKSKMHFVMYIQWGIGGEMEGKIWNWEK